MQQRENERIVEIISPANTILSLDGIIQITKYFTIYCKMLVVQYNKKEIDFKIKLCISI